MSVALSIAPIEAALKKFSARTAVGSTLRSADWAQMPLALRERAFFSAGVENIRALQSMQRELAGDLAMARDASGAWRDRSSFIGKVRQMVGGLRAEAGGLRADLGDFNGPIGDPRSLTDLASRARAGLIYDMNIRSAHGYARWLTDNDPDILDAFPAQELVRISPRINQRDWRGRWLDAGGALKNGRMVALKTDAIWTRISRFGTPWPPFDFGSGMGLMDVDRSEAEDLGLIRPNERIQPVQKERFNASLEASVQDLKPEFLDALKNLFGPQIALDGERVKWQSDPDAYEQALRQNNAEARALYQRLSGIDGVGNPGTLPGLVSAIRGDKRLFQQGYRSLDTAESVRVHLARTLPPEIAIHVFRSGDQYFLTVWNQSKFPSDPNQVERALATGGGRELGYGTDRGESGNLHALIYGPGRTAMTAFEVPGQFGRLFAQARALDFTRATGTPHQIRILKGDGRSP